MTRLTDVEPRIRVEGGLKSKQATAEKQEQLPRRYPDVSQPLCASTTVISTTSDSLSCLHMGTSPTCAAESSRCQRILSFPACYALEHRLLYQSWWTRDSLFFSFVAEVQFFGKHHAGPQGRARKPSWICETQASCALKAHTGSSMLLRTSVLRCLSCRCTGLYQGLFLCRFVPLRKPKLIKG